MAFIKKGQVGVRSKTSQSCRDWATGADEDGRICRSNPQGSPLSGIVSDGLLMVRGNCLFSNYRNPLQLMIGLKTALSAFAGICSEGHRTGFERRGEEVTGHQCHRLYAEMYGESSFIQLTLLRVTTHKTRNNQTFVPIAVKQRQLQDCYVQQLSK